MREMQTHSFPSGSHHTLQPTSPLPIGIEPEASALGVRQTRS